MSGTNRVTRLGLTDFQKDEQVLSQDILGLLPLSIRVLGC